MQPDILSIKTAEQGIRDQAAWAFRKSPRIKEALHFLQEKPREFQIRVQEFDMVIGSMNRLLKENNIESDKYEHLIALKNQLDDKEIPQLFDLSINIHKPNQEGKELLQKIKEAFTEVGTWQWLEDIADNNQLASAALIEGFGYLLQSQRNQSDVQRNFVLAFEEVGLFNLPKTNIMKDVLPWLVEEKEAFPPGAQQAIDRFNQ